MDPDFWSRLEAAWPKQSNSAAPIMNVPKGKGLDSVIFRHASSWLGIAGMNMRILKDFERHFPPLLMKAEHLKYHTGYTLVWIEFKNGVDTKMLQNQDTYTAALRDLRGYHSFDEASIIPYLNEYHDANYSLFHDIYSLPGQPNTHSLSPDIVQALVKATTGVSMVPVAVGHQVTNPETRRDASQLRSGTQGFFVNLEERVNGNQHATSNAEIGSDKQDREIEKGLKDTRKRRGRKDERSACDKIVSS